MKNIYESAAQLLRQGQRVALAVLLSSEGSTPRDEGAGMLMCGDGTIVETIGGGPVEYAVMRRGAQLLREGRAEILAFDLAGEDARAQGEICGGQARVCVCPLSREDLPVLERIGAARAAGERITVWLLREGGAGAVRLACGRGEPPEGREVLYREELGAQERLFLIGGGHVCRAAAQVAAVAGFDLVVADDRAEFANQQRFPGARCIVCQRYDSLPAGQVREDDYILIATRGHRGDLDALRWALTTPACYIGMIGSRTKRDLEYAALEREGVPRARLEQVHCPVGLPIGGRTPGDIAISILAEIVDVRARRTGARNVFTAEKGTGE